MGFGDGSGISWSVCKQSAPRSRPITTPAPHHSTFTGRMLLLTLSGNSLRQTVHTHFASVHQAAKLVAALLRIVGVTAGLAESNGSLPPGL